MKAKQIEKLLAGVMFNFLDSIKESEVQRIIGINSYITGGCIPSMLMDEWVNDYDIYFNAGKKDIQTIKEYFEYKHPSNKDDKYHVKLITDNAINLSDKIQLITRFTGTPEKVTNNFDWQHIKSYYSVHDQKLYLKDDVYRLIVEKELVYTGSEYPLSSLLRLKKYLKKGWNVSTTTMVHIALDIVASFNQMEKNRQDQEFKKNFPTPDLDKEEDINLEEWTTINVSDNFNGEQKFNIEDVIYHLNGVDPATIQVQLQEKTGQYLPISEIIKLMQC